MGLFSGIKVAKMMVSATYMGTGHYLTRIDNIKYGETRKKEKFLAIEQTVIAVLPSNEPQQHKIGDEVTHFLQISGNEYFLADFKQFIVGVLGASEDEVDETVCGWAAGLDEKDNPLAGGSPLKGTVVEIDNRGKVTKEGKNFTKVKYVREIKAEQVLLDLPPELVKRFFPEGVLEKRAAAEAAQRAAA